VKSRPIRSGDAEDLSKTRNAINQEHFINPEVARTAHKITSAIQNV